MTSGATITFENGTYSWTSGSVNLNGAGTKGVTLICATPRGCTINYGSGGAFYRDSIPSPITSLVRISGFIFNGNPGTATIWIYGNSNIDRLRIDTNTFQGQSSGTIAILLGESSGVGNGTIYGVIDHNIFTGSNNFMGVKSLTGGTVWTTGHQGTANNLFVEDNQFTFTNNSDLGTGCMDAWMATAVVFRYNTVTNGRYVNHSLCHGGPINSEVYGNTINSPTGSPPNYRNIHFQGSGETLVFNNVIGGTGSSGHLALQHYRSDQSQLPQGQCNLDCDGTYTGGSFPPVADGNRAGQNGYPCWHQPGRDANAVLKPIYIWNNRNQSGARVAVSIESGGFIDSHLVANRDYFEATGIQTSPSSPFNGTSGMGFGILANRPTTCTTNTGPDAGNGGVGYFATDVGPQGTLYRCSATNTWTVHYTPYTYPHPLQTDSGGGAGDVTPPTAPTNLRIQ
jgi:hypothetical protein